MIVDDSLVFKYLSGESINNISNHWVFHNIDKGKYLFQIPDYGIRDEVSRILTNIKRILSEFTPFNEDIYSALYPQWKSIIKDMNVLLVVGCPNPYDAMVREYDGKEYVIFDLIRFYDYSVQGYDIDMVVRQLITHETSHLCLHRKYPVPTSENFVEYLQYITFDEGFAHLISFKDNVKEFDFSKMIRDHYDKSFIKLQEAMEEKDIEKQGVLLEESNAGPYWSKFASISGKLFLAKHLDEIEKIYNNGVKDFISYMGL